ncbi:hypothetical protein F5Y01DRAFT_277450 [Xylaria sp. FL0043]|nr:hypothetical protein F5Y01DRAFT_277450 [Xylaria sp. FL0043]
MSCLVLVSLLVSIQKLGAPSSAYMCHPIHATTNEEDWPALAGVPAYTYINKLITACQHGPFHSRNLVVVTTSRLNSCCLYSHQSLVPTHRIPHITSMD